MLGKIKTNSVKVIIKICPKTYFHEKYPSWYHLIYKLNEITSRLQQDAISFAISDATRYCFETSGTCYDQSIVTQTRNIVSAAFSSDRKTFTGVRSVFKFLRFVCRFSKRGCSFGLNINIAAVAWAVKFGGNQQLTSRISMSSSGLNRLCGEISLHLI